MKKVLDDLLVNQEKLTKTERVKVFVTLSNYIFPKTKSVRDKFTLDNLRKLIDQGLLIKTVILPNNSRFLHKQICQRIFILMRSNIS